MNTFPSIGINTQELVSAVEALIAEAYKMETGKVRKFGAVNWGDVGVVDVEYRLSMLNPDTGPLCVVMVEEASPDCILGRWLSEQLDRNKFPRTHVECAW